MRENDLVLAALRDPSRAESFPLPEWDLLIRQARAADLLGRIAVQMQEAGTLERVPFGPRQHLQAGLLVAQAQQAEVVREVKAIVRTLSRLSMSIILLKGAGYALAGLPSAKGRLFSDIDILVPKVRLGEVEASLMVEGWATTHHTAYDQHYYRAWMHELPPMQHGRRGTVLDIHHSILPETARNKPDSAKLIANAVALETPDQLSVLAPVDMVLHSMTHLFRNEEFSHGLRDLSDLDLMLRSFGRDPAFWPMLVNRAAELGLGRVLHYGLRYTSGHLGTPVDRTAIALAGRFAPGCIMQQMMDALWKRVLGAPHASTDDGWRGLATSLLYLRSHWLRMPPWLLFVHLVAKVIMRFKRKRKAEAQ